MPGNSHPERIEPDAILEALVEFRIEPTELPELVLGRLLDVSIWAQFAQTRLPPADIPLPLRETDPSLRYQPLVELRDDRAGRVVKIGGRVLSYHVRAPYPGWPVFRAEIEATLTAINGKLKSPPISRIGIRYINILRPDDHHVHGVQDTNISLNVGHNTITNSLAVTYNRSSENHMVTVRVATPDLVTGSIQTGFSLLCDIDVATKPGNLISDSDQAISWIEDGHTLEKAEFFSILPDHITQKLNAQSGESRNA